MLEIALDKNYDTDTFRGEKRKVFCVDNFSGKDILAYLQLAKQIISHFGNESILILRIKTSACNRNMLALALFIESCRTDNLIDCVVIKVKNYEKALAEYKPYIALSIAFRLALRLFRQTADGIYRELENMQYLGLEIQIDYINKKIFSSLPGKGLTHRFITYTTPEAIAVAATLKALSLAKLGASVSAEININRQDFVLDENKIICRIMDNVSPWIH